MITKKLLMDPTQLDIEKTLLSVYKFFGTPTEETWPGVTRLPRWKKVKTQKPNKILNKMGQYKAFVMKGLVLNPKHRATTSTLIDYIHE